MSDRPLRIGLLMQRRGNWGGKQIIPEWWVKESLTPSARNPVYGLLWWLNTGHGRHASAPAARQATDRPLGGLIAKRPK